MYREICILLNQRRLTPRAGKEILQAPRYRNHDDKIRHMLKNEIQQYKDNGLENFRPPAHSILEENAQGSILYVLTFKKLCNSHTPWLFHVHAQKNPSHL